MKINKYIVFFAFALAFSSAVSIYMELSIIYSLFEQFEYSSVHGTGSDYIYSCMRFNLFIGILGVCAYYLTKEAIKLYIKMGGNV